MFSIFLSFLGLNNALPHGVNELAASGNDDSFVAHHDLATYGPERVAAADVPRATVRAWKWCGFSGISCRCSGDDRKRYQTRSDHVQWANVMWTDSVRRPLVGLPAQ